MSCYPFFKMCRYLLGICFLISFFEPSHATLCVGLEESQTTAGKLKLALSSWLDAENLGEEVERLNKLFSPEKGDQELVQCAVNMLTSLNCSQDEIRRIFSSFDLPLHTSCWIDHGLHSYLPGKSSLLGSWWAHLHALRKSPSRWIVANGAQALGYVATASMIFSMLNPVAAVEIGAGNADIQCIDGVCNQVAISSVCPVPEGPYQASCHDITVEVYRSPDARVPDACHLHAMCTPSGLDSLPQTNDIYYPQGIHPIEGLDQTAGRLTYEGAPLTLTPDTAETYKAELCENVVYGSFKKTCEAIYTSYESSDLNLVQVPLCKMQTTCRALEGTRNAEQVFFAPPTRPQYIGPRPKNDGLLYPIENCNGIPVQHAYGEDLKCNGAPDVIKVFGGLRENKYIK